MALGLLAFTPVRMDRGTLIPETSSRLYFPFIRKRTRKDGVPVENQYLRNFRLSKVLSRLKGLYIPSVSSQKW